MKNKATIGIAAVSALCLCACNSGVTARAQLIKQPRNSEPLNYEQMTDAGFSAFRSEAEAFYAEFAAAAYSGDNYAVSPVSVYMALALAAKCANGQTRDEILNALGTDTDNLDAYIPLLYRSINDEYKTHNTSAYGTHMTTGKLRLGNSVWLGDGANVKQPCIDDLADKYFCYSYAADFKSDNARANRAVRDFVYESTEGLIDKDFELDTDTLFALINTLYFKDVWRENGEPMEMSEERMFYGKTADVKTQLISGDHNIGRAIVDIEYSAFYTSTHNGNKIKFIVPNDGYTIDDVFTADNLYSVNTYDFGKNAVDHENKLIYHTDCYFPEYNARFDDDIAPTLQREFGINTLFDERCDMSTLTNDKVRCKKIDHVTELNVNKVGIEGAAVTVVHTDTTGTKDENGYTDVYRSFIVDRSFGFILTDRYGTVLFSGVINDI